MKKKFFLILLLAVTVFSSVTVAYAQDRNFPDGSSSGRTDNDSERQAGRIPFINFSIREPSSNKDVAFSVQLLIFITLLSIAPSLMLLMTAFLRLSIVLDFVKRALSLQQVPPTQVLNGIAFFLTLFIMWPTFSQIYNNSFKPMSDGQIGIEEAYREAENQSVILCTGRCKTIRPISEPLWRWPGSKSRILLPTFRLMF